MCAYLRSYIQLPLCQIISSLDSTPHPSNYTLRNDKCIIALLPDSVGWPSDKACLRSVRPVQPVTSYAKTISKWPQGTAEPPLGTLRVQKAGAINSHIPGSERTLVIAETRNEASKTAVLVTKTGGSSRLSSAPPPPPAAARRVRKRWPRGHAYIRAVAGRWRTECRTEAVRWTRVWPHYH